MRLNGKTAIVTGASRGLGLAISARLAREGACVVLADLSGAQEAAAGLAQRGCKAIGVQADVTSESSVSAMVEQALKEYGVIDILVNNAGIASTLTPMPFEKQTPAEWRKIMEVNVIGVFLCCRAVSPHLRARKSGRIINLSSATALRGAPFMLHYVASKGAIISMTRALAAEFGPDGVLVNAIAPGYILTDANIANKEMASKSAPASRARRALQRDGYPDDVVGTVVYLASDDSSFVSGEIISIDGGGTYH